jgi:hypothetical protein
MSNNINWGKIYESTAWGSGVTDNNISWGKSYADLAGGYDYLLDTYSGAAAAYSLRLLDSTYSGNAIKVRRASDNAEQDIAFVNNELDTATLETFAGAGDAFVTTWYDQSGNGRNATQTSASSQPIIVLSGSTIMTNGKPAILMTDARNALNFVPNLTQPFTYVNVITPTDVSLSNPYTIDGVSRVIVGYRSNKFAIYANSFIEVSGATNAQHLRFSIFNNTDSVLRNNGAELIRGSAGSSNTTTQTIGGTFISQDTYYQDQIFYNVNQESNASGIETNINDFYSIY